MKNANEILIVVDMQNDFVDGALGSAEAKAIVPNVVDKIKGFDGAIIVTYDTHKNDYMQTREGKYLPVPHCVENTDGWELNQDVENALAGKYVRKVHKPTFGAVTLPNLINTVTTVDKNTSITLVGLCTDICVVSNALLLKAYYPEADITVDSNCCAGVTPESHEAALTTMKMCQINIA